MPRRRTQESIVAVVKQFAELWSNDVRLGRATEDVPAGEPCSEIRTFLNTYYDQKRLEAALIYVYTFFVGPHSADAQIFMREAQKLEHMLPSQLIGLRGAANVCSQACAIAASIRNGTYEASLAELTSVIAATTREQTEHMAFVGLRPGLDSCIPVMRAEWEKAFQAIRAKVDELVVLDKYKTRFGAAAEAISKWSFDTVPWIRSATSTPEGEALSKKLQTVLLDYNTLCNVLETCAEKGAWLDTKVRAEVDETYKTTLGKKKLVAEVDHLAGSIILMALILQNQMGVIPPL